MYEILQGMIGFRVDGVPIPDSMVVTLRHPYAPI